MPGGAVAMPPGKQCNRCTKLFQPDELGSVAHLRSHIKVDKTPATPAELPISRAARRAACRTLSA